jgi:hypothetical protein
VIRRACRLPRSGADRRPDRQRGDHPASTTSASRLSPAGDGGASNSPRFNN